MSVNRKICRVCLLGDETIQLHNGHESIIDINEEITLVECFQRCTKLNVEEKIQAVSGAICSLFCSNCVKELESAYRFITKALKADQIIRSQYLGKVGEVGSFEWVNVKNEDTSTDDGRHSEDVDDPPLKTSQVAVKDEDNSASEKGLKAKTKNSSEKNATNKSEMVSCPECARTMEKRHLKRHVSRYHRPKYLLCHACPRTFSVKSNLRVHELTHEVQRDGFTCEKCGKKLISRNSYANHLKTHAADRKPLHKCDQCDKAFLHKGSLNIHQLQHKGYSISCHLCEKKFPRQTDLLIHQRVHTGEKLYKCSKCEKSFSQKRVLNKHLQRHENSDYSCNFCGKKYASYERLFYHRKEHTGMPFKCATCEKEFTEMYKIKRHIKGVHKVEELDEICKYIINLKVKRAQK